MSKRCSNTIGKVSSGLPGDVPGDVLQQAATFVFRVYHGANCLCVGLFRYASRAWKSGILDTCQRVATEEGAKNNLACTVTETTGHFLSASSPGHFFDTGVFVLFYCQ